MQPTPQPRRRPPKDCQETTRRPPAKGAETTLASFKHFNTIRTAQNKGTSARDKPRKPRKKQSGREETA